MPPPVPPGEVPGTARRQVLPLVPGLDRPPARRRPLPDAAGVRLIAVPDSAPPYDDERRAAGSREPRPTRRLATPSQPATPGQRPMPRRPPAAGQPGLNPARRGQAAPAEWP